MSPVPILHRQQALTRIGEIRIGGEKPQRGAGKKLEAFRLTSQHKDIIENCAGLYGGEPQPWTSPTGDAWQLYTTSAALPVLLVMGYSLKQQYELRQGQTCVRRCDGIHEDMSDQPCLCNATGKDDCDIITRLMVVLPETGTSLGWQLRSQGRNAADEIAGAMGIAENLAGGRPFVPATLRLTQRRSILDGQTVRYVVPALDFNLIAEAQKTQMLEAPRHTPVAALPSAGVTVEEGLALAETQSDTGRRRTAPMPVVDDIVFGDGPVPVPTENNSAGPPEAPKFITERQRKRLFALAKSVGLTTAQIREFVQAYTGQESTSAITVDAYEPLCAAIQAQEVKA